MELVSSAPVPAPEAVAAEEPAFVEPWLDRAASYVALGIAAVSLGVVFLWR
jgi:hypothetical protein